MSDETHVEWRGAPDFAEIAEALGVTTRQIMSARNPQGDDIFVLFTPTPDDTLVHSVTLKRGVDGVLFVASPITAHPGLWEEIIAHVERGDD